MSLFDPPEGLGDERRRLPQRRRLAGPRRRRKDRPDTILASPIILYDYPRIAPESPGDFFDGTEIDEMLTLRILTLTDEEKRAMAAVDERAGVYWHEPNRSRASSARTHGTIRSPKEEVHG